jgi:hypothetical protein
VIGGISAVVNVCGSTEMPPVGLTVVVVEVEVVVVVPVEVEVPVVVDVETPIPVIAQLPPAPPPDESSTSRITRSPAPPTT